MKIDYVSGSNVISFAAQRADLTYPALRSVEAYWDGLRNGRPVPPRSEIDPRGLQSALEYTFILERIAPGVARFRLAGSHLNDLMGMEVRGMPLTAMFVPTSRSMMSQTLEAVCESPQVTILTLNGERSIGRGALDAQLLLCPLKSDLGDVNRVLGCLQSKGTIGRQPRRFEIAETTVRPLFTPDQIARAPKIIEPRHRREDNNEQYTAKGTPIPPGYAEARKAYTEQQKTASASIDQKTKQDAKPKHPFINLVKTDA